MTRWLSLEQFEQICFEVAVNYKWIPAEPIPDFSTRYPDKLESCLAAPQQTFGGELLYPTLVTQAAILFYLLIKDHPFVNGNKRIALVTLLVFLFINDKWLRPSQNELYELTIRVASSDSRESKVVQAEIQQFIATRVRDILPDKPHQILPGT